MPSRELDANLFRRWLVVVYLPLAAFVICLALVVGRILTGAAVWLVVLLGLYCMIPVRLILETQRKGLELPKPPGATRGAGPASSGRPGVRAGRPPARRPPRRLEAEETFGADGLAPERERQTESRLDFDLAEEEAALRRRLEGGDDFDVREPEVTRRRRVEGGDDFDVREPEVTRRRPAEEEPRRERARTVPATERRRPEVRERVERPARTTRRNPQIARRRALASIIGIGVLLLVGGILVVVGIGRVTSSFGLVMVGVGGFLMILSVTLPTFRLVDAILRAIGRLLARRPAPPRPVKSNSRRRSA